MSYENITPEYYNTYQPDRPMHPGAKGWSKAPWPTWGDNPNLAGKRMLATNGLGVIAVSGLGSTDGLGAYFRNQYTQPINGLGAGWGSEGWMRPVSHAPIMREPPKGTTALWTPADAAGWQQFAPVLEANTGFSLSKQFASPKYGILQVPSPTGVTELWNFISLRVGSRAATIELPLLASLGASSMRAYRLVNMSHPSWVREIRHATERARGLPVSLPPTAGLGAPAPSLLPMQPANAGLMLAWRILGAVGSAAGVYHGYKRNKSVGWAIGWGLFGGAAPVLAVPLALAQGFGQPKHARNGHRRWGTPRPLAPKRKE